MNATKDLIAYVTASVAVLLGFVVCIASLFLPPQGAVDSSALWLIGQAFVFAGSIFGIKGYIDKVIAESNKK